MELNGEDTKPNKTLNFPSADPVFSSAEASSILSASFAKLIVIWVISVVLHPPLYIS